jgi:hypothetical protein
MAVAAMGALLFLDCGGKSSRRDAGRSVAGSRGTDEPGLAGDGGRGHASGRSGGAGGDAATAVSAPPESGAGGGRVCASRTVESRVRRLALEFVVEASGSMKQRALGSTLSRWQVVKDALGNLAQSVLPTVALGLVVFPADGECSTASAEVSLAPTTPEHAKRLLDALDAIEPAGGEPAHEAVRVGIDELVARASAINARPALVLVLDDIPDPGAQCLWDTDPRDAVVSELSEAVNGGTVRHLVLFGLPDSDRARQSLVSMSDEVQPVSLVDCSLPMPQPCEGLTRDPMTLEEGFMSLAYTISSVDYDCTMGVPELLDNPSVDLSHLTLHMTEDGQRTQTLTVARDDDCNDEGWRLKEGGAAITFCGSLCTDILNKVESVDLTVEVQFSCLE